MVTRAVTCQAGVRRYLAQTELQRLRATVLAAVLIQKLVRGYLHRRRLRRQKRAVVRIQAFVRGHLVRKRSVTPLQYYVYLLRSS